MTTDDPRIIRILRASISDIISFQYHYHVAQFGKDHFVYSSIDEEIDGIVQDGVDVVDKLCLILEHLSGHLHTTTIPVIELLMGGD